MSIPDWQLPSGVDRGLWHYLHAEEMVDSYDEQVGQSPLATADVGFCERAFGTPGRIIDLGCGTGRLSVPFAGKGFEYVGVDLSEAMLARARSKWNHPSPSRSITFINANLPDLSQFPDGSFDYAACLFSTLGMVRGTEHRSRVIANAHHLLKPGGKLVLHAHNRYFHGLGWMTVLEQAVRSLVGEAGDIAMSQAYGGAALILHHFSRHEVVELLQGQGFIVKEVLPLGIDGKAAWPWWRVYGWLILAERRA